EHSIDGFKGDVGQDGSVAGGRRLVKHVKGLVYRRFTMITETNEVSTARDRLGGYRAALEGAGLGYRPELVAETSAVDPHGAHDATLGLLDLPEPPTAIFAVNNIAVVGVAEAARERGLEIPTE